MEIIDVIGTGEVGREIVKEVSELIKDPVLNIVNPSTKTLGERLASLVDLVFTPIEMLQIYKDNKMEIFRKKLIEEIDAIPEEKKITPPINIVGPAVEASKYYMDDDELRDMFAKLIASSMNSDTSSYAQPSFVEIIKQMTPLDARILKILSETSPEICAEIFFNVLNNTKTYANAMPRIFVISLADISDPFDISISLENLERLKLIYIRESWVINRDYDGFKKDKYVQKRYEEFNKLGEKIDINIIKKALILSDFGKSFVKICI